MTVVEMIPIETFRESAMVKILSNGGNFRAVLYSPIIPAVTCLWIRECAEILCFHDGDDSEPMRREMHLSDGGRNTLELVELTDGKVSFFKEK